MGSSSLAQGSCGLIVEAKSECGHKESVIVEKVSLSKKKQHRGLSILRRFIVSSLQDSVVNSKCNTTEYYV